MAALGRYNTMEVVKLVDFGLYLDGGPMGEILLPLRYTTPEMIPGSQVEIFLYRDSEDRIIATTDKPYGEVGDFAYLEVVQVNQHGAFLDWGLMKDLFVPFREQKHRLEVGEHEVVHIFLDPETDRIVGSTKLGFFLDNMPVFFEEGEQVDLIVFGKMDIGYKVIVQGAWTGIVYLNEVFQPIEMGQKLKGYIKKVRDDEKLDITLQPVGHTKLTGLAGELFEEINKRNGFLALTDKSPAEDIYDELRMSKKNFKKALGALYKQRVVALEPEGVRIISKEKSEK